MARTETRQDAARQVKRFLSGYRDGLRQRRSMEAWTTAAGPPDADRARREYDACARELEARRRGIREAIELLRAGSPERAVLGMRYLDGLPWAEIQRLLHMSRASCFRLHMTALGQLEALLQDRRRDQNENIET